MFFYIAAILVATISHALASQIEVTGVPVKVSLCADKTCPTLSPYLYCAKFYIPAGKCCPVCECKDDNGVTYTANSEFVINQNSQCRKCSCKYSNGALIAECHRMYCLHLDCPLEDQEKVEGSCCNRCKPGWVKPIRTFPPFPQPGGGFPQPGGGFPQPGGGFPQPGGGFPQPGGGFPQPGGGFPQPGGGFPPFGDEGRIEDISERKSMKRKEE